MCRRSVLCLMQRRFAVAVALVGAVVAPAREALAYCRTTTVALPAPSYDPSIAQQCWMQGTPLAWPGGMTIDYSLAEAASDQVDLADATRVADLAFETWNATPCPKGPLSVQAQDIGPSDAATVADDCGLITCDPTVHDTHHIIVFRDTGWTHNDVNNTLALTTVTYGVTSGTIYDADIEINSTTTSTPPHYLTTEEPAIDLAPNTYDLQAILTHEAGHFLGLAHATASTSVMYAYYVPGSIALTADDAAGICAIYPPVSHTGCTCESAPAGPMAPGLAATAAFGLVAWARKRRRRS